MKIAWTVDDAPTLRAAAGVVEDPSRMDRIREMLAEREVDHCVAFVIGTVAQGHEDALTRWLEAGFELANHTNDHLSASEFGPDEFLRSVERCDRLLKRVGAFDDGRTRWFRHPYLDRGRDTAARQRITQGLHDLGYRNAPGSLDTYDHMYEHPMGMAQQADDGARTNHVRRRFLRGVRFALSATTSSFRQHYGRLPALIAYGHFGPVGDDCQKDLIDLFSAEGGEFVSLEEALADPIYSEFDADMNRTGMVLPGPSPAEKVARRALGFAARRGWFAQRKAGPIVPHLS